MHYNHLTSIEINLKNRLSAPRVSLSRFDQSPARAVAFRRIPAGLRKPVEIVTFLRWNFRLTDPTFRPVANLSMKASACRKTGGPLPIGLRGFHEPNRLRPGTLSPVRQPTTNRISL
jgi:hypothetical protein